ALRTAPVLKVERVQVVKKRPNWRQGSVPPGALSARRASMSPLPKLAEGPLASALSLHLSIVVKLHVVSTMLRRPPSVASQRNEEHKVDCDDSQDVNYIAV